MAVSANASLTLKTGSTEALVWMTDFASGAPVSGATVTLLEPTEKKLLMARPMTKDLSHSRFQTHKPDFCSRRNRYAFAVSGTEWSRGISNWDFGIPFDWNGQGTRTMGTAFTDRPIYRPGDTVSFKGIFRDDQDAVFLFPRPMPFTFVLKTAVGRDF